MVQSEDPARAFELIWGPMFSGKSDALVARLRDAALAGFRVVGAKPEVAADQGWIVSRAGTRWPAVSIQRARELVELATSHDLVAVDEVQFFGDDVVDALSEAASHAVVVVAGLDLDFRGEPFGPMLVLSEIASGVTHLVAICSRCGSEATRSQRLVNGSPAAPTDEQVVVERQLYEARCCSCFEVGNGSEGLSAVGPEHE